MPEKPKWMLYEELARKVLSDFRREFGMLEVEGKQKILGNSGTQWEIDGKAVLEGQDSGFLVIEARRHTSAGQKQEDIAALAYKIHDLGAQGGVIVSPLYLQRGASFLAEVEGIKHLLVTADSTLELYTARFLEQMFHGATTRAGFAMRDTVIAHVIDCGEDTSCANDAEPH